MNQKAIYYREQGAQCRKIAQHISLGGEREALLHMAETWERLAEEHEALSK